MSSEKPKDIIGTPSSNDGAPSRHRNGHPLNARVGASVGAIPKQMSILQKQQKQQEGGNSDSPQNSDSEYNFELVAKPKSTCIALSQMHNHANNLRQTQSHIPQTSEMLDRTWSVLYMSNKKNK